MADNSLDFLQKLQSTIDSSTKSLRDQLSTNLSAREAAEKTLQLNITMRDIYNEQLKAVKNMTLEQQQAIQGSFTWQQVQEEGVVLIKEYNQILTDVSKKYNLNNRYNQDALKTEKEKLEEIRKQGDALQRNAAEEALRTRSVIEGLNATAEAGKFITTKRTTEEAAGDLGKGSSAAFAKGKELIGGGNMLGGGAMIALSVAAKMAQKNLEEMKDRVDGYNIAVGSGASAQKAHNVANAYHTSTVVAAARLQMEESKVREITGKVLSVIPKDVMAFQGELENNTINLKTIRNSAASLGIAQETAANMITSLYQVNRRTYSAAMAESRATYDMAAIKYYSAQSAAEGIMSQQAFSEGLMQALSATSDYANSAEEVGAMMQSIGRIQGKNGVTPDKQAQQAQNIIGAMQGFSPELIMAMTGGGLAEAYNWPNKSKREMESVTKGAFGGLLGGMGGSDAEKMISMMAGQSLGLGMDARTARTFIEKPTMAAEQTAAISGTKETMDSFGKSLEATRGLIDKGNMLLNSISGAINSVMGNGFGAVNVKIKG